MIPFWRYVSTSVIIQLHSSYECHTALSTSLCISIVFFTELALVCGAWWFVRVNLREWYRDFVDGCYMSRGLTLCTSFACSLVHCVFHFNAIVCWRRWPYSSTWHVIHSFIHANVIHRQLPLPISNIISHYHRIVSCDRDIIYTRSKIRFLICIGFLFAWSNAGIECTHQSVHYYIL